MGAGSDLKVPLKIPRKELAKQKSDPRVVYYRHKKRAATELRQCVLMKAEDCLRLAVVNYIRAGRTDKALSALEGEFQRVESDQIKQ